MAALYPELRKLDLQMTLATIQVLIQQRFVLYPLCLLAVIFFFIIIHNWSRLRGEDICCFVGDLDYDSIGYKEDAKHS